MKVLILGGTIFVGRHLTEAALAAGHEVTIFNRGNREVSFTRDVEHLIGDRADNLDSLKGKLWDAVIDTCGYVPKAVSDSATLLSASVSHYTFISSISAYRDLSIIGIDEEAPLAQLEGKSADTMTDETYGALKALCEQEAEMAMPGRTLVVRPGLIVGPHDPTERFTYWIRRINNGGAVLAPGSSRALLQFIDARDLAQFIVTMAERQASGIYNATGPALTLTFGDFLTQCVETIGGDAKLHWASDEKLARCGISAGNKLPMWIPASLESYRGFWSVSTAKAIEQGLRYRPLPQTIRETLDWVLECPQPVRSDVGLSLVEEMKVLAAE